MQHALNFLLLSLFMGLAIVMGGCILWEQKRIVMFSKPFAKFSEVVVGLTQMAIYGLATYYAGLWVGLLIMLLYLVSGHPAYLRGSDEA
jgi:hypothetical protein